MKVSVRAGHILSPSLRPSAVGRATELCPALPETFLSLQGDLTIIPGKNINICYMHELTKWWSMRPKPCLCAPDDWLSDEYVSLMAAVLHCISHQVMSVVHHFAIEWWQG